MPENARPAFPALPGRRRVRTFQIAGAAVVLVAAALLLAGVFGGGVVIPLPLSLTLLVLAALLAGVLALLYSARSRRFRDAVLRRSGGELAFVSVASAEWAAAIRRVREAGVFDRPFGVAVEQDGIGFWREGESERALLVPWGELLSAHPGTATAIGSARDGAETPAVALPALWLRWLRHDGVLELPVTAPRNAATAERLLDLVSARVRLD